ncbi:MAG: hypothetical protein QOF76_1547 [Solirubrobacteraceae bacterium]|jgi:hypothetical protein|nr:hypothetical protein [Solirubrobacteraceae bacterium]
MSSTPAMTPHDQKRLSHAIDAFARATAEADAVDSIDVLLQTVAQHLAELVGVSRCSIHIRDGEAGSFVGAVCHGGSPTASRDIKRSRAGAPADGMTHEVLETRNCVVIDRAEDDPRSVQSTVRFWHIRSIMAAPMLAGDDVIGVILLDDEGEPHHFSPEDQEVARILGELAGIAVRHAQKRSELRTEIEASQRQLRALRRANAVDERLSDMVLEGQPLRSLLSGLAELLGKPCSLFRRDGSAVASAVPPGVDSQVVPRLLEERLAGHPDVAAAMAANDGSRAFVVGPLPRAGVVHRHVIAPIMLDGETWGHLAVMEYNSRFVGGDLFTVRRAATLVALQVGADGRTMESEGVATSALAAALVTEGDPALIQRRADRLGVRLDVPRVALTIAPRHREAGPELSGRMVAEAFERFAPELEILLTSTDGQIVAIATTTVDRDRPLADIAADALGRVCAGLSDPDDIVGGVSAPREGIEGYRIATREADQALRCLTRFGQPGGPTVATADRLGGGLMFLATADRELTLDFAESTLGWLVDDAARTDLRTTLTAFFDNDASIRRCAIRLGVHENTIRYRLGRIEALSGMGVVHDPDAQLRTQLSLLVLEMQGRLPAAVESADDAPFSATAV